MSIVCFFANGGSCDDPVTRDPNQCNSLTTALEFEITDSSCADSRHSLGFFYSCMSFAPLPNTSFQVFCQDEDNLSEPILFDTVSFGDTITIAGNPFPDGVVCTFFSGGQLFQTIKFPTDLSAGFF